MKGSFSIITKAALRLKEAAIGGLRSWFLTRVLKTVAAAVLTCILAMGGATVGTVVGAIQGQTTETGFLKGAGIGAVTGAFAALELLESAADCESLSKAALLHSLVNGKVFIEWVCPAVLKAYQWQVRTRETTYAEDVSDIYDIGERVKGLSDNCLKRLPMHKFHSRKIIESCHDLICCFICLQDFEDEESVRGLPNCGHLFHVDCVDRWLTIQGTCPVCRQHVSDDMNAL
ncbi:NEP1-interacting protein 1 [Morella rubra]|uniref:NEP1-interacting protein 1 n=1 Tax=Morella rubra TaxID=262757 RepID=A0A6A1VQM4_9ROSI|nr:NEP1-interacting protein 1 [Morella rubra]KAB1228050.1 NEP1-interacting protein 1 [Morella rubra]